jgi:hypothetical protein
LDEPSPLIPSPPPFDFSFRKFNSADCAIHLDGENLAY